MKELELALPRGSAACGENSESVSRGSAARGENSESVSRDSAARGENSESVSRGSAACCPVSLGLTGLFYATFSGGYAAASRSGD